MQVNVVSTTNGMDVTNYNKLKIKYRTMNNTSITYNSAFFIFSSLEDLSSNRLLVLVGSSVNSNATVEETIEMDISSIVTKGYITVRSLQSSEDSGSRHRFSQDTQTNRH